MSKPTLTPESESESESELSLALTINVIELNICSGEFTQAIKNDPEFKAIVNVIYATSPTRAAKKIYETNHKLKSKLTPNHDEIPDHDILFINLIGYPSDFLKLIQLKKPRIVILISSSYIDTKDFKDYHFISEKVNTDEITPSPLKLKLHYHVGFIHQADYLKYDREFLKTKNLPVEFFLEKATSSRESSTNKKMYLNWGYVIDKDTKRQVTTKEYFNLKGFPKDFKIDKLNGISKKELIDIVTHTGSVFFLDIIRSKIKSVLLS